MPAKNHLNLEQVKKLQHALKQEENREIREKILILLLLNDGKTKKKLLNLSAVHKTKSVFGACMEIQII